MIRLTNIKLPLDHQDHELTQAILTKLSISDDQLVNFSMFKKLAFGATF